ncbi:MAG: hypothetical protein O7H41_14355 [Planctomycetota bacterium]|nr:hypothetical protein [Planctomycetota bacterium]
MPWFRAPGESDLAAFIREGGDLRARASEDPLPIEERHEWVGRMDDYFRKRRGKGFGARLSDFAGMKFSGDGSDKFEFEKSIDGRIRRLNEFLREL